jgi:hypothetical protein
MFTGSILFGATFGNNSFTASSDLIEFIVFLSYSLLIAIFWNSIPQANKVGQFL